MLYFFQLDVLHAVDGGTPTGSGPFRCPLTGMVVGVAASANVAVAVNSGRSKTTNVSLKCF